MALPAGVKLIRTLRGPAGPIRRIAWSPDGRLLATPSADGTIQLWDLDKGVTVTTLRRHEGDAFVVRFDPTGQMLASGGIDGTVKLWEVGSGRLIRTLGRHSDGAFALVFDSKTGNLISGGNDSIIRIWDTVSGKQLAKLDGHDGSVNALAAHSGARLLASASLDTNVCVWDLDHGHLLHTLRGHRSSNLTLAASSRDPVIVSGNQDATARMWDMETGALLMELQVHSDMLQCLDYSFDGALVASKSADGTLCLFSRSGGLLATIAEPTSSRDWSPGIAFHPSCPLLAVVASNERERSLDTYVHLYEYDSSVLQGIPRTVPTAVAYATARIVLVGDSGVGKTGLGWRLAHGDFKEHSSTHGQQFWPLGQLERVREDGTQCEAILWDLAGQPDYRLTHGLFIDGADLALLVFDPTTVDNPLRSAEYWLEQLRGAQHGRGPAMPSPDAFQEGTDRRWCPVILVAARADRGVGWLSSDELLAFCEFHGIEAFQVTSALTNEGVPALLERMATLVAWDTKPATVAGETFKRIRDRVLRLKEGGVDRVLLTSAELRTRLEADEPGWQVTEDELRTAIGHLATHGHVTPVTSKGQAWVLLAPDMLNNLAASFVLEARRNAHGLGALEERQLLSGAYRFPELEGLSSGERSILTDAVTSLFIARNVGFRETDPLTASTYLIFPSLINLDRPEVPQAQAIEAGATYTLTGAVENVYASLVVLLGYTNTFTRRNQWRNHAQYVMGNGQVCGFRVEHERQGEHEFALYFGTDVLPSVRMLFQGLFESFLTRQRLSWTREEPLRCSEGHLVSRAVIRERRAAGATSLFCVQCGSRVELGGQPELTPLSPVQEEDVQAQRQVARARSLFEGAAYRMKAYATAQPTAAPSCFISYAWGNANHERWVVRMATDLLQAGVDVVLDRWVNQPGASMVRFVERAAATDCIIVVGTPDYRRKYDNQEPMGEGFVVAAEGHLVGLRLIGAESRKATVLPILLEGTEHTAFPHLLHGRVYADFRDAAVYFDRVMDLMLALHDIDAKHPLALELRDWSHPLQGVAAR